MEPKLCCIQFQNVHDIVFFYAFYLIKCVVMFSESVTCFLVIMLNSFSEMLFNEYSLTNVVAVMVEVVIYLGLCTY